MDKLVGKALFDDEFRAQLLRDPENAARSLRIVLTSGQIERIRGLDAQAMENLAHEFQELVGIGGPIHHIKFW